MPNWSAWQTPPPDPYFDQRVFQKLEVARHAQPAPASWWERWAMAGAWAGAAALLLISLSVTDPSPRGSLFDPAGASSLTRAYAQAMKGN